MSAEDASVSSYLDLFDPSKDPVLTPGWVSEQYSADKEQLAAAARKLNIRRAEWSWRLFSSAELATVTKRRKAIEGRGPAEDKFPFASPEQRLDDLRLLEAAIGSRRAAMKPLSFYEDCVLVHIEPADSSQEARRWLMMGLGAKIVRLLHNTGPIHALNEIALRLNDDNVEEYAAFFCAHTVSSAGGQPPSAFVAIEEDGPQDTSFPASLDVKTYDTRAGDAVLKAVAADPRFGGVDGSMRHASAFPRAIIGMPLTLIGRPVDPEHPDGEPDWLMVGTLLYRREAFRTALTVSPRGPLKMDEDNQISGAGLASVTMSWPTMAKEPS